MLHDDIINPLVSDYIDLVTGLGYGFFNSQATTRLNDFTTYLSSLIIDRQFAFYPLRKDQNIGFGNTAFGIGLIASGAPVNFPQVAQWTESGMIVGSNTPKTFYTPPYSTHGIIDFSKKSGISFRGDDFSIFYFMRHIRDGEYTTTIYRGENGLAPYFICDNSPDWFQIIAPCFSTSRFKPKGTTYIYDEIFGEDKKGLQLDWSQKESEKYYLPQSISFHDPEKDRPKDRFYCLNLNGGFSNYTMRFIFGRDPNILSGTFSDPYSKIIRKDGEAYYEFPNRFAFGAGASNFSAKFLDTPGLDHITPGILITKGNYGYVANEIATAMLQGIGLVYSEKPQIINNLPKDIINSGCVSQILSLNYYETFPTLYNKYPKELISIIGSIRSIEFEDYGKWGFNYSQDLCGNSGCYGGWIGRSPRDISDIRAEIQNTGVYKLGVQITGTYGNLQIGEPFNFGIIGFISGTIDVSGKFSGFAPKTPSGHSGFYYNGNYIIFPPYPAIISEKILGYISGEKDRYNQFIPYTENSPYYGSGYYFNNKQIDFKDPQIVKEPISGFQYGILDKFSNYWSGFKSSNILSSSGYILSGKFNQFLPNKNLNKEFVTGFWYGSLNNGIFGGFTDQSNLSGILTTQDPNLFISTDQNQGKIFFPSGGNFTGFSNIEGFDQDLKHEFSGFFFNSSGFYPIIGDENALTGIMTGHIGYKYFVEFSGEFSGADSITGFSDSLDIIYNGFFVNNTFFSGIEFDPVSNEFLNYGTGYLIGNIGNKNILKYYSTAGFDNRSGFDPVYGYNYTGFTFPEGSGFSGINGNENGSGVISGYIGSRNLLVYTGEYSGFTGLLSNYNKYLPNVIFPNFDFTRASGFVGPRPGNGMLTGIISTGYVKGDAMFVESQPYTGIYIAGIIATGMTISGFSGVPVEQLDYSILDISGEITGTNYIPGLLSGKFFDSGYTGYNPDTDSGIYDIKSGSYISGSITGSLYLTGLYSIQTSGQFELESGFVYESGSISAQITEIDFNNAIANLYILQNNNPESGFLSGSIYGVSYTDSSSSAAAIADTGTISGGIYYLRSFSTLVNETTGIDSGKYSVFGIYNISISAPAVSIDNINYNISGNSMNVFDLYPPVASVSYINDVATNVPYVAYFTGINLQTTGIPTVDNWYWDMNGDAVPEFNQNNISFVYTQTGTYTFSLTATNASGSSTAQRTIIIRPAETTTPEYDPYSDYVTLLLLANN